MESPAQRVSGDSMRGRPWIEQACHAFGWLAGWLAGWTMKVQTSAPKASFRLAGWGPERSKPPQASPKTPQALPKPPQASPSPPEVFPSIPQASPKPSQAFPEATIDLLYGLHHRSFTLTLAQMCFTMGKSFNPGPVVIRAAPS